jgi:hypothetical protein
MLDWIQELQLVVSCFNGSYRDTELNAAPALKSKIASKGQASKLGHRSSGFLTSREGGSV